MKPRLRNNFVFCLGVIAIGLFATGSLRLWTDQAFGAEKQQPRTIEMFAGIDTGDIEVKLIPKNDRQATVLIKNNTDKPLAIRLPQAFAGVPVLAQFGGGMGGMGGGGMGGMGGGGNQGMGGGMGGGGMGGGFFNVAPQKVGKIKVATVCLEHGKADPSPRVPYQIKPLEVLSSNPQIRELCGMLARGEIDQRSAQVAAWHLENGLSWEQLANKYIKRLNGGHRPYFSRKQIIFGMRIVAETRNRVKSQGEESPGERQQRTRSSSEKLSQS